MFATLTKLHTYLELYYYTYLRNYDEIYACFWKGSSLIKKFFLTLYM